MQLCKQHRELARLTLGTSVEILGQNPEKCPVKDCKSRVDKCGIILRGWPEEGSNEDILHRYSLCDTHYEVLAPQVKRLGRCRKDKDLIRAVAEWPPA